uniref:Uncharacterized protein n=1 Tax=Knipowitschia caucasica TaxID=637954 RepID=A0AAV2JFD9_KNICA
MTSHSYVTHVESESKADSGETTLTHLYNMDPRGSGSESNPTPGPGPTPGPRPTPTPGPGPTPGPAPSSVSMRSDRSNSPPPEFREDGPEDQRLYNMDPRGSGPGSKPRPGPGPGPAPSSQSLKSDRSNSPPPEFREDGPEDQR